MPVRQWVLSFPRRVRWHLARDDKLLSKVIAIFNAELSKSYKRRAPGDGILGGQTGAVTFVQRFGSALNLNVHLHVVVYDDEGSVTAVSLRLSRFFLTNIGPGLSVQPRGGVTPLQLRPAWLSRPRRPWR